MNTAHPNTSAVLNILADVTDPEIPVLTIEDMGLIREIDFVGEKEITITITPTYSGCPAMNTIEADIKAALAEHFDRVTVKTVLSPAWTTDWLSEEGKEKLKAYGIAPPVETTTDKSFLTGAEKIVPCPRCSSTHTVLKSQFGSTPCKSLYICEDCKEPFDYFKCH